MSAAPIVPLINLFRKLIFYPQRGGFPWVPDRLPGVLLNTRPDDQKRLWDKIRFLTFYTILNRLNNSCFL